MDDEEKQRIEMVDAFIDRVEEDGVAVSTVDDGTMFGFTAGTLRRMLADAEAHDRKMVVCFVQRHQKSKVVA